MDKTKLLRTTNTVHFNHQFVLRGVPAQYTIYMYIYTLTYKCLRIYAYK